MGTLWNLQSGTGYQISAVVGNQSLENSSLIWEGDKIRPYFIDSVENDPDLTGLRVEFQRSDGAYLEETIEYLLQKSLPQEEEPNDTEEEEESPAENEELSPEGEEEPAPEGIPLGTGDRETEPREEEKKGRSIPITDIHRNLPVFTFPDSAPPGVYTMMFRILGRIKELGIIEKQVYYLGDAEFRIDDMAYLLPGYSGGSHLIAPGTQVMLEARISSGPGLDPYLRWYEGKKLLSQGRAAEGARHLLWKAPDRTGFQIIRLEALPFPPDIPGPLKGREKELSLPVSSKAEVPGYFPRFFPEEEGGRLLNLYLFEGDLKDSAAGEVEKTKKAWNNDNSPHWDGYGGVYGLALGPGDPYEPTITSFQADPEGGKGTFLLRFKPLSEGEVLRLHFQGRNAGGIELVLSWTGDAVCLEVHKDEGGLLGKIEKIPEHSGFISLALNFSIALREPEDPGNDLSQENPIQEFALSLSLETGEEEGASRNLLQGGEVSEEEIPPKEKAPEGMGPFRVSLSGAVSCQVPGVEGAAETDEASGGTPKAAAFQTTAIMDELAFFYVPGTVKREKSRVSLKETSSGDF